MSYEAVLEQIKAAPEECLDEISDFIDFIVSRHEKQKARNQEEPTKQLASAMLEALQISKDPSVKGFNTTKELFEDLNA
ncbi:hypothetical protein J5834_00130 [bacterium]|nr:hypothetical protein [bacterium]